MKTGDAIEHAVGLIPGVKNLPCYDKTGQLKPESGCGRMKQNLNNGMNLADALFDRFWPSKPQPKE